MSIDTKKIREAALEGDWPDADALYAMLAEIDALRAEADARLGAWQASRADLSPDEVEALRRAVRHLKGSNYEPGWTSWGDVITVLDKILAAHGTSV
jgi:hypothetical protein